MRTSGFAVREPRLVSQMMMAMAPPMGTTTSAPIRSWTMKLDDPGSMYPIKTSLVFRVVI
jgi:hypothetical protein